MSPGPTGQKLDIAGCSMGKLLALSNHIWLLNGGDGPFSYFIQSYPSIRVRPPGSPHGRSRAWLASAIHDCVLAASRKS